MASITISDLRPTGFDLFSDSEGYMNYLDESEFDGIYGGATPIAAFYVGLAAARSSQACAAGAVGLVNGAVGLVRLINRD